MTTAQFSSGGQRLIAGDANGVSRLVWDLMGASAQPLSLPGSTPVQHGFMLATFESDRFRVWVSGQDRRVTASIRKEMRRAAPPSNR